MYICVVTYLHNSISRYQKVYDAWSEGTRTAGETKHFLTWNVYRIQSKSCLNIGLHVLPNTAKVPLLDD